VLEIIGNRGLLRQVAFNLKFLNSDILVVTASKRPYPQLVGYPKLRAATDVYLNKGVLGGIYTGLKASDSFYNLAIACDMPLLNRALLHYMLQISADFDPAVPRLRDMVEPIHAVYPKGCLAPIES